MESSSYKPVKEEMQPEDHKGLEVAAEQIVYCEDDYDDGQGEMVQLEQLEQPAEVPCYVMDNSFYSQVNLSAVNRDHSTCHYCGEDLSNKRFYNHLFDHHGFTKQQCEMLKQQKRLENYKNRTRFQRGQKMVKVHACAACGMEFVTKTGLTSHMSKSPGCSMQEEVEESTASINNIVCPSYGCDKNVPTYLDLAIHVDTDHRDLCTVSDSFRIRRVTFPDKESFLKWKRSMEKDTCSEFFLRTSQKVNFAVRTLLYKCLFSNSRGQSKGRRCEQCPAFIKCCQRNHGQFEVVACFGHLGHEHPTETSMARDMRVEKYRQIDNFQETRMQNERVIIARKVNPPQVLVDEYGQPAPDGMMILMPEDEGEESFDQVLVEQEEDDGQHAGPSSRHY